ncbi:MAG: glycosyltransferase family protein [Syntrophaceae bacterium]|nr:glycosyltransferase family protein [Syntrophaceae bacterium]
MARIVFGVMGDAMGHITFSSIVASLLPEHTFLFLGGGKVTQIAKLGYDTVEIPMLSTYYSNNQVDLQKTISNGARILFRKKSVIDYVERVIRDFSPDFALSNYEYFTPLAAARLGIPCVSVDHQHILTECKWPVDPGGHIGKLLLTLPLKLMYSNADKYIVSSFFSLTPKNPRRTSVTPSVLRPVVRQYSSSNADHVLVYQTSPSFLPLLETLKKLPGRFRIYGFGAKPSQKNLEFKANSVEGFLEDLSSCRYAIVNGGHNVISESLYYGKPILCFPIRLAYEQHINAFMIKYLGYGDYSAQVNPDLKTFEDFESKLDHYQAQISRGDFFGNEKMAEKLRSMIV